MEITPEIKERIILLQEKYNAMGQDLISYLDGLLYSDYLTYWDYIHLDTLLSLQTPRTSFPDEEIFIMYHQITELYFKLSLHELKQISNKEDLSAEFFAQRIKRVNNYFEALTKSFEIMINGMEPQQFLKYRMALLPASGFQSAQYRMIEMYSTSFNNLLDKEVKDKYRNKNIEANDIENLFQNIYWKRGATELASGKKTLTLQQFENKYTNKLVKLGRKLIDKNILKRFESFKNDDSNYDELRRQLRIHDVNVNINWPLVHYKSAARYLQKDPSDIKATGGTNWQKYLPPRFQKRIFYPNLWTQEEIDNWGKKWVETNILS